MTFEELKQDEQHLVLQEKIYSMLTECPTYWIKKGFLKAVKRITVNGDDRTGYKVTLKGFNHCKNIAIKKLNLSYQNREFKAKIKTLRQNQKQIDLLNLMEAQHES